MTIARCARLTVLLRDPFAPRHRGPAAYHCMRLGWTEWVWKDGRAIGETVTQAGQLALARYRGQL